MQSMGLCTSLGFSMIRPERLQLPQRVLIDRMARDGHGSRSCRDLTAFVTPNGTNRFTLVGEWGRLIVQANRCSSCHARKSMQ